jgi:hypothetical protein
LGLLSVIIYLIIAIHVKGRTKEGKKARSPKGMNHSYFIKLYLLHFEVYLKFFDKFLINYSEKMHRNYNNNVLNQKYPNEFEKFCHLKTLSIWCQSYRAFPKITPIKDHSDV